LPALLPGEDDQGYCLDEQGHCWRATEYLPGSIGVESAETPRQAEQAAAAVGIFLQGLADLDPALVQDTLPGFHESWTRFEHFQKAVAGDAAGRLASVHSEVAFVQREARIFDYIKNLGLPQRVVHNDPKIANVLFDARSGEAIAVIDWDTIQAGSFLSDFGDMVRSMTPSFSEDEADFDKVELVMPLFEALARGFVPNIQQVMTPLEKANLLQGAFWIILEQMMRFLGDYLNGDVYYKVRYPEHNLVRARNQQALYVSIQRREPELARMLNDLGLR
jgi:N-acetylhexosamine 1-kinase